jgi:hypothetical protein
MAKIREHSKWGRVRSEDIMLSLQDVNSHSEHDLFIRLFLTGGGGW